MPHLHPRSRSTTGPIAVAVTMAAAIGPWGCGGCEGGTAGNGDGDLDELWLEDPAAAIARVNEMPDELEQMVIIEELFVEHGLGTSAPDRCEGLERAPVRDRCQQWLSRPHLFTDKIREKPGEPVETGFCSNMAARYDARLTEYQNLTSMAKMTALQNTDDPARLCDCLGPLEHRSECYFVTAEEIVLRGGLPGSERAIRLCGSSPAYGWQCVTHLLLMISDRAPPPGAGLGEPWQPLVDAEEAVRELRWDVGPKFKEREIQLYWGRAWFHSLAQGGRLPVVSPAPPEVHQATHMRAAAAWLLVAGDADGDRDLGAWDAAMKRLLAGETELQAAPAAAQTARSVLSPRQPPGSPADGTFERLPYLGYDQHERAVSEDEGTERTICLIEALAHQGRLGATALDAIEPGDDAAISWTIDRARDRLAR